MTDTQGMTPDDERLDAALAALRHEEPAAPIRRDAVWARIEAAHGPGTPGTRWRVAVPWRAAAAVLAVVASGALWWRTAAREEPVAQGASSATGAAQLLADVGRFFDAASRVAPGSPAADSLGRRGVLLLASARAAMDRERHAARDPDATVWADVEYVLVQVAQGALSDPFERDLAVHTIRSRRLVARASEGGL